MENRLIKAVFCFFISTTIMLGGCFDTKEHYDISYVVDSSDEKENSDATLPADNSEISLPSVSSDEDSHDFDDKSLNTYEDTESSTDEECTENETVLPDDEDMVLISDYIPTIKTDIRYATVNNFTEQIIYESHDVLLRYGTVKKLRAVQNELNSMGLSLLIWDAYRPPKAQWKLWEICPDANFVSDPNLKYSSHSRGNTMDITVVTTNGEELEMPSGFDEFGATADRDYSDVSETAAKNSQMLEEIMKKYGFKGYSKEWWHYSDTNEYPVFEEANDD